MPEKDAKMKCRIVGVVGFVLIAFGCTSQVSAEWFFGLFNWSARETKRRQCWPEPFVHADRVAARAPLAANVQSGWERQNLLGDFHFQATTGQLTEAGRNKLRWIFLSAPPQHRIAFVHAAETKAETDARVAAVQQVVTAIAPEYANANAIHVSTITDDGWPAEEVNKINRKFLESTPVPRLPEAGAGGGAGGADTSAGTSAK
jgi:hypothetical protein